MVKLKGNVGPREVTMHGNHFALRAFSNLGKMQPFS